MSPRPARALDDAHELDARDVDERVSGIRWVLRGRESDVGAEPRAAAAEPWWHYGVLFVAFVACLTALLYVADLGDQPPRGRSTFGAPLSR